MKKFLFILLTAATAAVAADAALPVLEPTPLAAAERIKVDGRLDEPVWERAPRHKIAAPLLGKIAAPETNFQIVRGDDGLYFAFQAEDRKIVARPNQPHDSPLWSEDSIELEIAPVAEFPNDANDREFTHLIFNAAGCRYDGLNVGGETRPANPYWRVATRETAAGYEAEVFIPYYSLPPRFGVANWRMQLARTDKDDTSLAISTWSPTRRLPDTAAFGILKNPGGDAARYRLDFISVAFDPADSGGCFKVQLGAAPGRAFRLATAIAPWSGGWSAVENTAVRIPVAGVWSGTVPSSIKTSGRYRVRLLALDENGIFGASESDFQVDLTPFRLALVSPCYRDTLYASEHDRHVRLRIETTSPSEPQNENKFIVTVLAADGKVMDTEKLVANGAAAELSIDVSRYPTGTYIIDATGAGAIRGNCRKTFQIVPAAPGTEVRLDSDGTMLVNGQAFFPRGFMGGRAELEAMRRAGANTIQFYSLNQLSLEQIRARLDACRELGLMVIMSPMYGTAAGFWGFRENGKFVPRISEPVRRRMRQLVAELGPHPALLGWYIYDEPRGAEWHTTLKTLYAELRELDPWHPVFGCNNSAGGVITLRNHADIQVLDLYIKPFLHGAPLRAPAEIAAGVQRAAAALAPGCLWFAPQAFDEDCFVRGERPRTYRAPTLAESRVTVYAALNGGARGILPYKIGNPECRYFVRKGSAGIYADPELKIGFLSVIIPELAALEGFFARPSLPLADVPAGLSARYWRRGNRTLVVAVNTAPRPLGEKILSWPGQGAPKVLSEKRTATLRGGKIHDDFPAYAVHIYTDDPEFSDNVNLAAAAEAIRSAAEAEKK